MKRIITTVCTMLVVASASAEDKLDRKYYVQGNLGYAMGVAPGGNFEQNTFGNAEVYSAAIGYKFDDHIRADWSIEYRDGYQNKFIVDSTDASLREYGYNPLDVTDHQTTNVRSLATMINMYYDIAEINKVTPYFLVGMGVARNTTFSKGIKNFEGSSATLEYTISKGIHANFAWKAGAGAKYQLNNAFDLDFHYQYVNLGIVKTGRIQDDEGLGKEAFPVLKGKLQSHEFLLGANYKF